MTAIPVSPQRVECSLAGSCTPANLSKLIDRLTGICGARGQEIRTHELVYAFEGDVDIRIRTNTISGSRRIVQVGNVNSSQDIAIARRQIVDVKTDGPVEELVCSMGGKLAYGFLATGWLFKSGARNISVRQIFKLDDLRDASSMATALSEDYLVEASSVVMGEHIKTAESELTTLAKFLQPYVDLRRIDPKRPLPNK